MANIKNIRFQNNLKHISKLANNSLPYRMNRRVFEKKSRMTHFFVSYKLYLISFIIYSSFFRFKIKVELTLCATWLSKNFCRLLVIEKNFEESERVNPLDHMSIVTNLRSIRMNYPSRNINFHEFNYFSS